MLNVTGRSEGPALDASGSNGEVGGQMISANKFIGSTGGNQRFVDDPNDALDLVASYQTGNEFKPDGAIKHNTILDVPEVVSLRLIARHRLC